VSFKIYDNLKNVYKCIEEQVFMYLYIHIYDDRDSSRKYWVWGLLTVILLKDSTLKAKQNKTKPNQIKSNKSKNRKTTTCFELFHICSLYLSPHDDCFYYRPFRVYVVVVFGSLVFLIYSNFNWFIWR